MTNLETLKEIHEWWVQRPAAMNKFGLSYHTISDTLDWAIRELEAPDWIKAGDGTLHGAITHWQTEALKEKVLRQSYQEQLCTLQDERARLEQELVVAVERCQRLSDSVDRADARIEKLTETAIRLVRTMGRE